MHVERVPPLLLLLLQFMDSDYGKRQTLHRLFQMCKKKMCNTIHISINLQENVLQSMVRCAVQFYYYFSILRISNELN